MNTNKIEMGQRLKKFLNVIGMPQAELAKRLSNPRQNISKYINGTLNIQNITADLHEIGCNLTWLFTGEGSMFADNEAGRKLAKEHEVQNTPIHEFETNDDSFIDNDNLTDSEKIDFIFRKLRQAEHKPPVAAGRIPKKDDKE